MYRDMQRTEGLAKKIQVELSPSARQRSMKLLVEEMKSAGVTLGVIPGRRVSSMLGAVANEPLLHIVHEYPDQFVAFAGLDVSTPEIAAREAPELMSRGFKGVVIEPGHCPSPMYADDPRIYCVYEVCQKHRIPLILMAGGNAGPDLSYSMPVHLDRVAADFPQLIIIAAHGCWPWVTEGLGVAFRRKNIYISPDMYMMNLPGASEYGAAACGFLQDQFIFASAYPMVGLSDAVACINRLPATDGVKEKLLYKNAARVLGITGGLSQEHDKH
jgi:predicted TIM-barrel fold metal-dependent hydrolase